MSDIFTIIRKEAAEIFGDWQSFYGVFIQAAIVVGICGIIAPSSDTTIWLSPGRLTMLYAMFPSALAATFAADAFAGERERHTLPTLLATPVSDAAIFIGKVATAVSTSLVCSVFAISAGVTTTLVVGQDPLPVVGVRGFAALLGGAFTFAMMTTAFTITVSSRVKVARAAQQISTLGTVGLGFLGAVVVQQLGLPPTWGSVVMVEVMLFAAGVVFLSGGVRAFGRGRGVS